MFTSSYPPQTNPRRELVVRPLLGSYRKTQRFNTETDAEGGPFLGWSKAVPCDFTRVNYTTFLFRKYTKVTRIKH